MNIFVTGGSGFLGGHLIEALSTQHAVFALARSERSAAVVAERGARPVLGDLQALDASALDGMDVVIHAAAFVGEWGKREAFEAVNVDGTRRLIAAARAAGVGRLIHISTNAAVFQNTDQFGVDEAYAPAGRRPFFYAETKAAAEEAVLAADAPGFFTLVLRPCFIWGPRDTTLLPTIVEMAEAGRFVWLDGGRKVVSTTHVANLVHAVQLALTEGRGGEAYFIADDDDLSIQHFLSGLAQTRGTTLPKMSLPGALVRPLASLVEGAWLALGLTADPPLTRMTASLMSTAMTVRTDKARAELAWAPVVSRAEGLAALS